MKHIFNKKLYESRYPNIELEVAGFENAYQTSSTKDAKPNTNTLALLSDWIYFVLCGLFSIVNSLFELIIEMLRQTKVLPYFRFGVLILLLYVAFVKKHDATIITNSMERASLQIDQAPLQSALAVLPLSKAKKEKDPFAEAYIERFSKVAKDEMRKFGIPASIKLAQGLLESNNGKSKLAAENFNHFGLKCFSKQCTAGHCSNHNDDHHKDFFRKYRSAWESWRDHSQFLTGDRYKHLLHFNADYKKWAKGLKKAGYATDKKYADKLIELIERYELDQFDRL